MSITLSAAAHSLSVTKKKKNFTIITVYIYNYLHGRRDTLQ